MLSLVSFLLACQAPQSDSIDEPEKVDPRVVVLVMDGARVDESTGWGVSSVTGEPTEDLLPRVRSELWPSAAVVHGAVATGVPITTEGHIELFTGLRQPLATFPPARESNWYRSDVPTIFEATRHRYDLHVEQVGLIVNTILIEDLARSAHPLGRLGAHYEHLTDESGADLTDSSVIVAVKRQLEAVDTRLMVANLHQIDMAGHNEPSPAYAERVLEVDGPIADLWAWLDSTEPYAGATTLILVADHGRHRWNTEEDWREHGDQCTGCRQIPLLMIGRGIEAGETEGLATLEDVGRTVATLLDLELPHAVGQPISAALTDDTSGPQGDSRLSVADARMARQVQGIPGTRSVIEHDGVVISSPAALHAEAPSQTPGMVCWRELTWEDGATDQPWQARCETWEGEAADPDLDVISPYWSPALATEDQTIWMADIDSPYGYTGAPGVRPRLSRWSAETGWQQAEDTGPERSLPLAPGLAVADGVAWVAAANSPEELTGRDTRQVELWRVDWPESGEQTWTEIVTIPPSDRFDRLEHAALGRVGDRLLLGAMAYGDEVGTSPVWTVSEDEGQTWSDVEIGDPTGAALPLPGMVWTESGEAAWLRWDETVWLCTASPGLTASCTDTCATAASDLAADGDDLWATLWSDGVWAATQVR